MMVRVCLRFFFVLSVAVLTSSFLLKAAGYSCEASGRQHPAEPSRSF